MSSFQEKVVKEDKSSFPPLFASRVYKVVSQIPRGQVLSYKEVAKLAGSPRAWRAVGNIMKRNPDLKHIPCHRVVKSDGRIGGYRYGKQRKMSLLKQEGVIVYKRRIVL